MAHKKARSDRPTLVRTMPRRAAAPGNLNETHLQRTQEAGARAAAATTRPTQKKSRVVAQVLKTPKSKNPTSTRKRGKPASKKLGAAEKEKEKEKKPALKKVKNGRVANPASNATGKSGGKKTGPQSPVLGSNKLSSTVNDFDPMEVIVSPRQVNPEPAPIEAPEGTSRKTPKGSQKTPEGTSKETPKETPNGVPMGMLSETPSTLSRTPRPSEMLSGRPSRLSQTPRPRDTPIGTSRGMLSAVPRRLFDRTPMGRPSGTPRGMHIGTPSPLSRTLSESPEQNGLPPYKNTDLEPYDPTVQYEEVYDSEADLWELRRQ